MKINRIFLFLILALLSWSVCDATEKPLFSNEAEEHWYYVYYENLSHVFQENGEIDGYWNDPTDSNNNFTFIPTVLRKYQFSVTHTLHFRTMSCPTQTTCGILPTPTNPNAPTWLP